MVIAKSQVSIWWGASVAVKAPSEVPISFSVAPQWGITALVYLIVNLRNARYKRIFPMILFQHFIYIRYHIPMHEDWFEKLRHTRLGQRKREILRELTSFREGEVMWYGIYGRGWVARAYKDVRTEYLYRGPYDDPAELDHWELRNRQAATYRSLASLEASGLVKQRQATLSEIKHSRLNQWRPWDTLSTRTHLWSLTDLGLAVVKCYSEELLGLERTKTVTPIRWDRKRIMIYYAGVRKRAKLLATHEELLAQIN